MEGHIFRILQYFVPATYFHIALRNEIALLILFQSVRMIFKILLVKTGLIEGIISFYLQTNRKLWKKETTTTKKYIKKLNCM